MKKRRKIFQRAAALLCCILMIPCLGAVPVSAEDSGLNLIELGLVNPYYRISSSSNSITISLPYDVSFDLLDFVFTTSFSPSAVYATSGSNSVQLTLVSLGSGRYRCYGKGPSHGTVLTISFSGAPSSSTWFWFKSFNIYSFQADYFEDITSFSVTYSIGSSDSGNTKSATMDSPGSRTQINFSYGGAEGFFDYLSVVNCDDWKNYDYVDVILQCRVGTVDSIICQFGTIGLPISISYLDTEATADYFAIVDNDVYPNWVDSDPTITNILLRVDLRDANRLSSNIPCIKIRGTYDIEKDNNYFAVLSYTGLVLTDSPSALTLFWNNLKGFLSDIFSRDQAASDAQIVQSEIDYEVNLQIVGAMENWDSNISVVKTGYDDSLVRASPALIWLSTLADNVFNNMGWFGNIYLMLGLFSLFLFILSKSGLPHSIGRISRRD